MSPLEQAWMMNFEMVEVSVQARLQVRISLVGTRSLDSKLFKHAGSNFHVQYLCPIPK